ncbi:SpoIIIAH-like family protein [Clostridium felsineum]|uniref:Uncharacterized protein n=1 Tax=Clostridium felsineum TaxID=36839 RepID=A0A1S8L488_9CLOT|nr:SpoIIIAH-like family protein [Clostridium felsineum]MCR3760223.1 SpoIIIAH-like family protein [Clostridium felsineum]URZ00562.1 hypothetical protein CLAUR_005500 [Clostridium felsineum]URZ06820.1 hypothetical protein CLROS_021530 [Clostridium felsineum]URZ11852.1 hypothetical protein CROST_025690 [Clostridium felsineum]
MNKKQAVIIVTLMVLIVCAGVLATRVRSPLYVNDTDFDSDNSNKSTVSTNDSSKKISTKTDIFAQGRLEREQKDQREIQTLKNIVDDKNVSNDTKASAQQKMMTLSDEDAKCNKVETMLKSKGFKEALCSITDSKVTITVKSDSDKLTDNQLRDIKEVVTDVTKIRNIEVLQPVH